MTFDAKEVLRQLGGRQFIAMTGARHFTAGPDYLTFQLPARMAAKGINAVRITLDPMDTYTVEFLHIDYKQANPVKNVARHEDIYCDQLVDIFEEETKLVTRMPKIIRAS